MPRSSKKNPKKKKASSKRSSSKKRSKKPKQPVTRAKKSPETTGDSEKNLDDIAKKLHEIESAIESEKDAMEKAKENRDSLKKQVFRHKIQSIIHHKMPAPPSPNLPTEDDVEDDIHDIGKDIIRSSPEFSKRKAALVWGILTVIIFSSLLFSESFLKGFTDPSIDGYFIMDMCTMGSISCSMDLYDDTGVFHIYTDKYKLEAVSLKECENSEIKGNEAYLSYCDFKTAWNTIQLEVTYKNPVSGLSHKEKASVVKNFEISSLSHLGKSTIGAVSSSIDSAIGMIKSLK